jgi:tetratricopeptide (TPR) repeat protein
VAVQLLNKAMKMDPNSDKIKAEYHRTMAQVLINQQKIPDALNELDQALSANPRSKSIQKDYHLLKSKLLRQEGKYLLASEEAQKAMELDPHSPAVLFNYSIAMGYWHKSQKELGKAIEEFKKASEIFPKTLGLQIMLGQLFYESGEYEESVFHFKAVLEKTPENFKAHYYLAKVYENKEWIDLAQEQWSWVLLKSTKAKITEEARAHLYLIDKIRKEKSS